MIGRDPRASGEMLEAAVIAGLTSEGVDALRVGVLPTPAVAYLTGAYDADFGVMISASHNPMPDNGIKIFGPGGHKLDDDTEDQIEELVAAGPGLRPVGAGIGRVIDAEDAAERYLRHVSKAQHAAPRRADRGRRLRPRRGVVGGAAGLPRGRCAGDRDQRRAQRPQHQRRLRIDAPGFAAVGRRARTAPTWAWRTTGTPTAAWPSTPTANSSTATPSWWCSRWRCRKPANWPPTRWSTTVMSNLGLHLAMRSAGIAVRTTGVGDRYVLEELRAGDYSLGGEQSGHIVMPALGSTGDGIVTGLRLMTRMAQTGSSLAELASAMRSLPQVLINVEVADKATAAAAPSVQTAVDEAEAELGDTGRILLRPSGTEPMIRVMVEAADEDVAQRVAARVAEAVSDTR